MIFKKGVIFSLVCCISLRIFSHTIDFTFTNACFGDSIEFTAITSYPVDSIKQYRWDLDGSELFKSAYGKSIKYLYNRAGTFKAKLMIVTIEDVEDPMPNAKDVIVYPLPNADFSSEFLCQLDSTRFRSKSTISSGAITNYYWTIAAQSINNYNGNEEFIHIFKNYGNYAVKLEVKSDSGCVNSIQQNIKIGEKPKSDFSFTAVCLEDSAEFTNLSAISTDTIFYTNWQFGDGENDAYKNFVKHKYDSAGTFEVRLITVANKFNMCSDTAIKYIEVGNASGLTLTLSGDTVFYQGEDLTITANGDFTSYIWSTGDITNNITVTDSGTYAVTATDSKGCEMSDSVNVIVKDAFNKVEIIPKNTVITPNGDNVNDCLEFKDLDAYGKCELIIYNKWGHEVERIPEYKNDWSGTSKGRDLETGVYFYVIKGEKLQTNGNINILREK